MSLSAPLKLMFTIIGGSTAAAVCGASTFGGAALDGL